EIPLSLQRARELGGQLATFVRGEDLLIEDGGVVVGLCGRGGFGRYRHHQSSLSGRWKWSGQEEVGAADRGARRRRQAHRCPGVHPVEAEFGLRRVLART